VSYRDDILELFRRAATDREHGAVEIERTLIRGLLDIEANGQSARDGGVDGRD
jgi:hypothetical protein